MRKMLFVSTALVALSFTAFGQEKLEQFCQVNLKQRTLFSSKYKAEIIYGSTGLIISSNQPKVEREFDTVPDALNYLGALGWKLFSTQRTGKDYPEWDMIFKKEIIQVKGTFNTIADSTSKAP